jgi:hypothetical protein
MYESLQAERPNRLTRTRPVTHRQELGNQKAPAAAPLPVRRPAGEGFMQRRPADHACCARCGGSDVAARAVRRQRYRAAVPPRPGRGRPAAEGKQVSTPAELCHAVTGTLLDVSPHILVIAQAGGEQRLTLTATASVWRGGPAEATQLRPGERIVVRLVPGRRDVVDKVWASIGRVAGTITAVDSGQLLVDEGTTKRRRAVIIAPRAANRVQVRFPVLEPGSLIDVIGLRRGPALEALVPATSQPAYLASRVARGPAAATAATGTISGSATWHEPVEPDEEMRGVAYPAIDPAAGCAEQARTAPGGTELPYLAVGSTVLVRNECTGAAGPLPVTGCGAVARLFQDRCMTCGTSPRGRIVDLTLASFVELGGEPERGCFNATITVRV